MTSHHVTERPQLPLPGALDSIRPIGEYVLEAAADAGLEKTAALRLRLAVEEIATNAVVHGYQRVNLQGDLLVAAHYDEERLTIICEESGPAYDPRHTPMPEDLARPLTERPEGGLGVYLALMGVDEYDYQRVNDTNRHIFVQYLNG
jgi:anti-sigma regulatory factor (Ser/Thr protein kinase)